jgi:hypothetical protein
VHRSGEAAPNLGSAILEWATYTPLDIGRRIAWSGRRMGAHRSREHARSRPPRLASTDSRANLYPAATQHRSFVLRSGIQCLQAIAEDHGSAMVE